MKRILFVRHGSTDSNTTRALHPVHPVPHGEAVPARDARGTGHGQAGVMRGWSDDPLSALGQQQAEQTARFLCTLPKVDGIYTSTLPRSIQTGRVLARQLHVAMHTRDDLRELNLGTLEGRRERELWDYFVQQAGVERGLSEMRDVTFPGGESASHFLSRVLTALADIRERHPDGSVLIVSHGVFTMVALGMWLDPDVTQWPKYRVDNGSVSEVWFEPEPRLVRLNETKHLEVSSQ